MTAEEKVLRHRGLCEGLNKLYEQKNHDYGDSFHQTFVEEGMAMPRIRLGDKFSRFKTLTLRGDQQVADESVRDTLLDLANYALMTVLEMDLKETEKQETCDAYDLCFHEVQCLLDDNLIDGCDGSHKSPKMHLSCGKCPYNRQNRGEIHA